MIPDPVLDTMASAMLDPELRTLGGKPTPALASGNRVRCEVLRRALTAAEAMGWVMVPTTEMAAVAIGEQ
jgi:hypothetical protein